MFSLVSNHGNCYHDVIMGYIIITGECHKLSFNTTTQLQYAVIDKPVSLDCKVPGSHDLKFKWKRSGHILPNYTNGTLELGIYDDNKSGTYSCLVSNDCNKEVVAVSIDLRTAGECINHLVFYKQLEIQVELCSLIKLYLTTSQKKFLITLFKCSESYNS